MGSTYYTSSLSEDDQRAFAELKARITAGAASPEELARFLSEVERLQQEREDLLALYSITVDHATEIENELLSRNHEVSRFLADMSHELRTPLNAIIGYSEMVYDEASDLGMTQVATDLKRIMGAGKHLLGLINDVLDLSKVEAGRLELVVEPISVADLVADVVATIEPLASKRGNDLSAHVEDGLLHSDATRLRQVLINLAGNAVKFTEGGQVSISARQDNDGWYFDVADTGIGMTSDELDYLFQPFRQASARTSRQYGGTGLGLALSLRLVRAMGGDIEVHSVSGDGTTFGFFISDQAPPHEG